MHKGITMRIAALLFLVVGVLVACGKGDQGVTNIPPNAGPTSTTGISEAPPAGPAITISGNAYSVPITVGPGQQVTVVNNDQAAHSVTADGGLFDVRASGSGGQTTLTAPSVPGTYAFHCRYHSDMHGTLTVQ